MLDPSAHDVIIGRTTGKLKRRIPPSVKTCVTIKRQQRISRIPSLPLDQTGFCPGPWPHSTPLYSAPISTPQLSRHSLLGLPHQCGLNCASIQSYPTQALQYPAAGTRCLVPCSPVPNHLHGFGLRSHQQAGLHTCSSLESQWPSIPSCPFLSNTFLPNGDSLIQSAFSTVSRLPHTRFHFPLLKENTSHSLTSFLTDFK